jgi:hypothetical protein
MIPLRGNLDDDDFARLKARGIYIGSVETDVPNQGRYSGLQYLPILFFDNNAAPNPSNGRGDLYSLIRMDQSLDTEDKNSTSTVCKGRNVCYKVLFVPVASQIVSVTLEIHLIGFA